MFKWYPLAPVLLEPSDTPIAFFQKNMCMPTIWKILRPSQILLGSDPPTKQQVSPILLFFRLVASDRSQDNEALDNHSFLSLVVG
jgi:hypothetical protein